MLFFIYRSSRLVRLSNTFDGRLLRLLLSRYSSVRLLRLSNIPSGRLLRLLLFRSRYFRLVSLSNTPDGKVLRLLYSRPNSVRLVSLSNTPDGRVLRLVLFRYSTVRLVRSLNTPDGRLLRLLLPPRYNSSSLVRLSKSFPLKVVRDWSATDRLMIVARSSSVISAQSVLSETEATIALRTGSVRLQIPFDCACALPVGETMSSGSKRAALRHQLAAEDPEDIGLEASLHCFSLRLSGANR